MDCYLQRAQNNTRNIDESKIDIASLTVSNRRYLVPHLSSRSNGILKILYLHSGSKFACKSDTYHYDLVEAECNLTLKFRNHVLSNLNHILY